MLERTPATAMDATVGQRSGSRDARIEALLLRQEVEDFNARYCQALDENRLADWAEMFAEDAFYVIISRENHERGRPVGLIYCEGRGMIRDRAFAIEKTAMFAPRYLRHYVTNVQVASGDAIRATANYLVMQVLFDRPDATIHQIGRYEDVFRRVDDALVLAERRCIYDSLLVPNALCLPV